MRFVPAASIVEQTCSPSELKACLDWGGPMLAVLDVRSRRAFNAGHIRGAISVPADQIVETALRICDLTLDIYLYDNTGSDAVCAALQLREVGFQKVFVLVGGFPAWHAAGYPIGKIFR